MTIHSETEAKAAVDRVVMETSIVPDCVSAGIVRDGTAVQIRHNAAVEIFIGTSYDHAAEKAIAWFKTVGVDLKTDKVTKLNRAQRRRFNKLREKQRAH